MRLTPASLAARLVLEQAYFRAPGDSAVDVQTARNAGVRCCGVSYGFQPESFETDPPDLVVDNLEELADLLLTRSA